MPANTEAVLSRDSEKELLRLARASIEHNLESGTYISYSTENEELTRALGAFVSLHKGGSLRGCVGFIAAEKPLYKTVIDVSVSAALRDSRFPPVSAEELDECEIELSVLTPLETVEEIEEIEVGRDGLLISDSYHSGLLLPQVATNYGWDREEFLGHTCVKAGLPGDAWRGEVSIERFQAQVFDESILDD